MSQLYHLYIFVPIKLSHTQDGKSTEKAANSETTPREAEENRKDVDTETCRLQNCKEQLTKVEEKSKELECIVKCIEDKLMESNKKEKELKMAEVKLEQLYTSIDAIELKTNENELKTRRKNVVTYAHAIGDLIDLNVEIIENNKKMEKEMATTKSYNTNKTKQNSKQSDNKRASVIKHTNKTNTTDAANEESDNNSNEVENNATVEFIIAKKRFSSKTTLQATVDNVKFYCNSTDKNGLKTFRCSFYDSIGCKARFTANQVFSSVTGKEEWKANDLKNATWHEHETADTENLIEKAKAALKVEVLKAPLDKRKADVYTEFHQEYKIKLKQDEKVEFEKKFPTYKRLRMTMWRWQKEKIPKAPRTQKELDVALEYFYTPDEEYLVIGDTLDEDENRIITLGIPSTMIKFSESSRLNIDCTYKIAPQPNWASILIFQARVDECWAPLTYTLLPNEEEETLKIAYEQVRKAAESHGKGFTMECEVMFDFDGNLRNTYKEVIGNDYKHTCRGCSFHFGQCICR